MKNKPNNLTTKFAKAWQHFQAGSFQDTEFICNRILNKYPNQPDALHLLGLVATQRGNLETAIRLFNQVISLSPNDADCYHNLGIALSMLGRNNEAIQAYKSTLHINANHYLAYNKLGDAYESMGHLDNAMEYYRRAISIKPDFADAYCNMGMILHSLDRHEEAIDYLRKALDVEPDYVKAIFHMGAVLQNLGRFDAAIDEYRRGLCIHSKNFDLYYVLGGLLQDLNRYDEALECFNKAIELSPGDSTRIKCSITLPSILQSYEHIELARRYFDESLSSLLTRNLVVSNPIKEIKYTNFFLCYHGKNDRKLQIKMGRLHEKLTPALKYSKAAQNHGDALHLRKKIHIGFISEHFNAHTIGVVFAGIIKHLDRERFHVSVFSYLKRPDKITSSLRQCVDDWVELPQDLEASLQLVASHQLNVLVYTDIGMDIRMSLMAVTRLAAVQCVTWGHPVTSGIKNIDYYISCWDFEPPGAAEHYSEKLILLKSPPTYYYHPYIPSTDKPRSHFGLSEKKNIYLCVQHLFKFHPDFDGILSGILETDDNGEIILVHGTEKNWGELLLKRLRKSVPDVIQRIRILPRLKSDDYFHLLKIADVLLDTLHFGGGSTTYQGLAVGTPIVTLPGKFMRGRFAYGLYKKMELLDCIAADEDDYVRIATKLGMDKVYRDSIKSRILARNQVLFEDMEVVREFEKALIDMVDAKTS